MAGSDIPLLNHYKKEFVLKRIPQTFLGGLALRLGYTAPCYIYFFRILLWFMPWIIGGAFTAAVEVAGLMPMHGCIGNGLVVGVIVLLSQIASKILSKKSNVVDEKLQMSSNASFDSKNMRRLLAEEDEEIFESCWSSHTFLFIIPPNRYYASIFINSILSSFICGMGLWYSLPFSTLTSLYGYSTVSSAFLFIFLWISLCVSHYPLLIGSPIPETAAYRTVDIYGTRNMWRALHVSLFLCIFLIDLIVDSTILSSINSILHIIFCTLPLLWLLGIIPPFDALLLWAMEQFLIFVNGGSCMSTDWRLLLMTIMSSGVLVGASFLTSTLALVGFCVAFGYILSTDVTSIFIFALTRIAGSIKNAFCRSKTLVQGYEDNTHENAYPSSVFSWKPALWHCVMFSLVFVATFLCHYFISSSSNLEVAKLTIEIIFICIFVITIVCGEFQRVYFFFGIFRNCLYPLSTLSQVQFLKRKKILRILGIIHGVLMYFIFPLLASIYLSVFEIINGNTLPSFVAAISYIHGFRFVWQRPGNASFCFVLLSILNLIPSMSSTGWATLYIGTRLIVIDLCRDRFFQFVDNVWFAVTLLITLWTDKKQRRSSTIPLICLNIIFFPITLVIIALASVLSAPLLPLFTLPIFLVGFPRPNKFWPSQPGSVQANICPDTMYYHQLTGPVAEWFSSQVSLGVFGVHSSCSTSSPFYIARAQDRTLWIQVLESGCGYSAFSLKGLELQETSCHAMEATRLDDAFDIAFEKTELDLRCLRTNQYVGTSSVTPVDSAFIDTYSDSKTSLAGIIDQRDCMKQVHSDFLKSLSWLLVHNILAVNSTGRTRRRNPSAIQSPSVKENEIPQRLHTPFETKREVSIPSIVNSVVDRTAPVEDNTDIARSLRSDSMVSFTSLLSTDNENATGLKGKNDIEMKKKTVADSTQRTLRERNESIIKDDDDDDWDIDSILSDSGYGLPAADLNAKKKDNKNQAIVSKSTFGNGTSVGIRESYINLGHKDSIDEDDKLFYELIPSKWNDIPVSHDDIESVRNIFDRKWLERCVTTASSKHNIEMQPTAGILSTLTNMILACDVIVNVMGVPARDPSLLGSDHLHQVYRDDIPWSPALDWLIERKDLHDIVVTSFRYAVKLMYDQASLGVVENYDELIEYFTEYDEDWFVGMETDPLWKQNIVDGMSNLFAVNQNKSKKESSVRVLSKQPVSLHSGRVNPAAVRGIWANFAMELIYATNDDEERYSIQAHLSLLRNLIIQAVDPPLGYPIFSSPPLVVSSLPMR